LLLRVELHHEHRELLDVACRRRRQRAGVLHGPQRGGIVRRVARALLDPDVADLAVRGDAEADRDDQAGTPDDVRPPSMDGVDHLLAIGEEFDADQLTAAALPVAARADRAGGGIGAAEAAAGAVLPALGERGVRVVRRRVLLTAPGALLADAGSLRL